MENAGWKLCDTCNAGWTSESLVQLPYTYLKAFFYLVTLHRFCEIWLTAIIAI
jgi:hypothetical protein